MVKTLVTRNLGTEYIWYEITYNTSSIVFQYDPNHEYILIKRTVSVSNGVFWG